MRSEAAAKLFFRCAQRNIHYRSRTCQIFTQPREWSLRTSHLGVDRKGSHLRSHQFLRSCCNAPLIDWLPACVAHDFCNPEDLDALGYDSSFFAVTQQQWRACVRSMLRCELACTFPSSSLDPTIASGAFAVAKDESRDSFIGDRRPMNSAREASGARTCISTRGFVA